MCPASHPHAYYDGLYCCKHDKEKSNGHQGTKCDGSTISITSKCCLDDAHIRCPNGYCQSSGIYSLPPEKATSKIVKAQLWMSFLD